MLTWSGREAKALRLARRMSIRAYAAHLGVAVASVANWERRGTAIRLRHETQEILDRDLAQLSDDLGRRFQSFLKTTPSGPPPAPAGKPSPTTAGPESVAWQRARIADLDAAYDRTPPAVDDRISRGDLAEALPAAAEILVRSAVTVPLHSRIAELVPPVDMEGPRRIGSSDVARIEATTSAFRDWDNRWGGGLSCAAVVAHLQWVAACAAQSVCSSQKVKNRLLTALADLAGVAAFRSYDMNHHPQARSLWIIGLDAAVEAGNVDLAGTTLRQLAHQSLHVGRADEALRLVRLSYATAVDPGHDAPELALAETAAYEGWCHAAAGKLRPCQRAFGRAQEHFANVGGEPAPPWLSHLDTAELTALQGHSYHVLAQRVPDAADEAAALLRRAVASRGNAYARSRTLNLIALSGTYFQRGTDLEEGVAVGDEALRGAGTLTSPRALDRLRALKTLTIAHTGLPAVALFQDRLDRVLTDA
ncbi:hypothetical protein GCM10012284_61970 [Mangrovihabitans endophyticus]|uniref:HTH cro/C1-type domain-containing protein n=1 Tax=Mangrovihabitans endophyticus TaxID=1751298 RepID=A0A8J3C4S7_9ACTN|nr:hypothetical protein GCM10012284_61970 [Mangrovihabitans endophyticus]